MAEDRASEIWGLVRQARRALEDASVLRSAPPRSSQANTASASVLLAQWQHELEPLVAAARRSLEAAISADFDRLPSSAAELPEFEETHADLAVAAAVEAFAQYAVAALDLADSLLDSDVLAPLPIILTPLAAVAAGPALQRALADRVRRANLRGIRSALATGEVGVAMALARSARSAADALSDGNVLASEAYGEAIRGGITPALQHVGLSWLLGSPPALFLVALQDLLRPAAARDWREIWDTGFHLPGSFEYMADVDLSTPGISGDGTSICVAYRAEYWANTNQGMVFGLVVLSPDPPVHLA